CCPRARHTSTIAGCRTQESRTGQRTGVPTRSSAWSGSRKRADGTCTSSGPTSSTSSIRSPHCHTGSGSPSGLSSWPMTWALPRWLGCVRRHLLLADDLGLGTLALGGTLVTFYMDRGRRWLESTAKPLGLDPVAESVGMPLMRPVLGVTEIGTMRMTAEADRS